MGEDIRESFVPFNLNRYSLEEEIKELTTYCLHDVRMTYKVFEEVYYKYEASQIIFLTPLPHFLISLNS